MMTQIGSTLSLQDPAQRLKGIGTELARKLAKIHIETIQDLLLHLPTRYIDRTRITPIAQLQHAVDFVVEGVVESIEAQQARRRSLICRLDDGSGRLGLRFFHFSNALQQMLSPGTRLRCFGECRKGASGLEMYHPELQILDAHSPQPPEQTLTAIYPLTAGVSQRCFRRLVQRALERLRPSSAPALCWEAWAGGRPPPCDNSTLIAALAYLHLPPSSADAEQLQARMHPYQRHLAFEELLAHRLAILQWRQRIQARRAPRLTLTESKQRSFLDQLPFSLTSAQRLAATEITRDMANCKPMLRLLQGDVGSGKTVIAALAAVIAMHNRYQVALMVPTEILAQQHRDNLASWLRPFPFTIGQLLGKQAKKEKQKIAAEIASGNIDLVIGTHTLFQQPVQFARLGLTIVDEQHRFGVHQRLLLLQKAGQKAGQKTGQQSTQQRARQARQNSASGANDSTRKQLSKETNESDDTLPHQLVMTATPIPRTLAMSTYTELDFSLIRELPPGRKPVRTVALSQQRRPEVVARLQHAVQQGRQVFWICTLIDESETLQAQAAQVTADELAVLLPAVRIGLLHGRLKGSEKDAIMTAFKHRELDVLVATTVVEVGVDVPNASVMIIENPERLGLAQLHQLRGRVGRGATDSYCLLLYNPPLSRQGRARIEAMRSGCDGFKIAEIDLALRGPGEVLGTRQTGEMSLKIADLVRDAHWTPQIQQSAHDLLSRYPVAVDTIVRRWLKSAQNYSQV